MLLLILHRSCSNWKHALSLLKEIVLYEISDLFLFIELCKKKPFLLIENLTFGADISKQKTCLCCQGKDSGQSYNWTPFVAFGWTSPTYGWWQPTFESFKCFDAEDSGHYFLKMLLFWRVFGKLFLTTWIFFSFFFFFLYRIMQIVLHHLWY